MTQGFNWTPFRDRLLRQLRRDGVSLKDTAVQLGCDVEHVRMRLRDLALSPLPVAAADVCRVPRPVAVKRPGLIDLSKAPSAMESRFRRGGQ